MLGGAAGVSIEEERKPVGIPAVSAQLGTARIIRQEGRIKEMTAKWLTLIVACIVGTMWVVYAALKALNGILYEIGILRRYLDDRA